MQGERKKEKSTTDKITSKAIDDMRQGTKKRTYTEGATVFDAAAVVEDCGAEGCVVEDCMVEDCVVEDCVVEDGGVEDCMVEDCVVEDWVVEDCEVGDWVVEDWVVEDCVAEDETMTNGSDAAKGYPMSSPK